jgi:RNA polymerase sigma factor (sigma-70 family)
MTVAGACLSGPRPNQVGARGFAVKQQEEFQRLLGEIQGGSEEAAQQFLDRYGEAVLRVIRRRLDPRMRSKFDSTDFVQDVWASFFRSPPPPDAFTGPESLFRYLTTLARNKVVDGVRQRLVYQKYNLNRELPQEDAASDQLAREIGRQPTPSQVFVAKEQWERATRGRTQLQLRILGMLRDGHTHEDIALALGLSDKMVQRLVRKLSARLNS